MTKFNGSPKQKSVPDYVFLSDFIFLVSAYIFLISWSFHLQKGQCIDVLWHRVWWVQRGNWGWNLTTLVVIWSPSRNPHPPIAWRPGR